MDSFEHVLSRLSRPLAIATALLASGAGCGWLAGSLLRSDLLAAMLGYVVPATAAAVAANIANRLANARYQEALRAYEAQELKTIPMMMDVDTWGAIVPALMVLGLATLITGTLVALFRRTP